MDRTMVRGYGVIRRSAGGGDRRPVRDRECGPAVKSEGNQRLCTGGG